MKASSAYVWNRIDLDVGSSPLDRTKTKRMDKEEIKLPMDVGGGGQSGSFTWRERNRRKLAYPVQVPSDFL